MKSFQERLEAARQAGNLKVSDLARWFDRPHPTIRGWLQGMVPGGGPIDAAHAKAMLGLLEVLIRKKAGLPVPRLSPKARIEHLAHIRETCLKVGDKLSPDVLDKLRSSTPAARSHTTG